MKSVMVSSSCSFTLIQKSEVGKTETGGLLSLFLKAATTDRRHGESLELTFAPLHLMLITKGEVDGTIRFRREVA